MAPIVRFFSTLLGFTSAIEQQAPLITNQGGSFQVRKSIAIIGGGTGGLATLKTLLEFTQSKGMAWDIDLLEQRHDVGGIWLPDSTEITPPSLPSTPLYPRLRTNTPHPLMTIHGFPFPERTNLYPSHDRVLQYHKYIVNQYGLAQHIHVNHTVISSNWLGNSTEGQWALTLNAQNKTFTRLYDYLVVAAGRNHYPHIPEFQGLDKWLENSPPNERKREVLHSVYYRNPRKYRHRSVLVVGGGASGKDIAMQIGEHAKEIFHSVRSSDDLFNATLPNTKPEISHLNSTSIIFVDGSSITTPDSIILATGYELRYPFLSTMLTRPIHRQPSSYNSELSTNMRYIRPLHEHILSLSSKHRLGSLYFVGLPTRLSSAGSDAAQALFIANTIANPAMLPSRDSLLAALIEHEASLLADGFDPEVVGHTMLRTDTAGQKYQEQLIEWLRERGASTRDGLPEGKYIPGWRRLAADNLMTLRRAWRKVESLGEHEVRSWLEGIQTEDEWGDLMSRLIAWNDCNHCGNDTAQ